MYPPEDLRFFLDSTYSPSELSRLFADERYATWLLVDEIPGNEDDATDRGVDGGRAVGYVLAGPAGLPHRDIAPGDGEVKRLYILADHQGGGWGRALFETALEWLDSVGPRTLWLGVWSENFRAQRLYARYGFERAGEYEFPVGLTRDHEFIFRRPAPRLGA
ncbi:GNAT family N-acetyltransferase [Schaalia sp. ZJ405]|nr:GNAT family N-acetyltransferase [Schaalia sp. ZJ405]